MTTSINALIIDPKLDTRVKLKSAMRAISRFRTVIAAADYTDAQRQLTRCKIDIVFIPESLNDSRATQFRQEVKDSMNARDAAYVVLLDNESDTTTVSANLLNGADGFLIEPFSVDTLLQITELAETVKLERQDARVKSAICLLVTEIVGQLGQLARIKKTGGEARLSQELLREMCSVLPELEPRMQEFYFSVLLETLPKLSPPTRRKVSFRSYSGASQRIRKRLTLQAIDKIKTALSA